MKRLIQNKYKIVLTLLIILCSIFIYFKFFSTQYYTYEEAMKLSKEERRKLTPKQLHYLLFNDAKESKVRKIIPHNSNNTGADSVWQDVKEYNEKDVNIVNPDFSRLGLTEKGMEVMRQNDPQKTLKIEYYKNPAEREELIQALAARTKLKFLEMDDREANDLYSIKDRLYTVQPKLTELSFIPSVIPSRVEGYYYIGYADDANKKFYGKNHKLPMVRKVFERNDGNYLIFDEENLQHGGEIAIEEFLTHRIKNYPAQIHNLKAKSSDRYAVYLRVSTKKSMYTMYVIGQMLSFKDEQENLIRFAREVVGKNV